MGGRGSSSHNTTRTVAASNTYRNAEIMAQQMRIHLNIDSLKRSKIIPHYLEETLQGVKAVYDAFPVMKGKVRYIDAEISHQNAYASAGGDGGLHMGLYGRWSKEHLERQYAYDIAAGFHPVGTTSADIFVHEMGHQIEAYLNDKNYNSPWAWGRTADRIVFEAAQKVDPSITSLHSTAAYQLAKDISDYAVDKYRSGTNTWSTWETLAEAVADYHANKERAKPLSKEIWNILKREMR